MIISDAWLLDLYVYVANIYMLAPDHDFHTDTDQMSVTLTYVAAGCQINCCTVDKSML